MKATKRVVLAAASVFAFGLWVGSAAAGESTTGDPAAGDFLTVPGSDQLGTNDLSSASTGQVVTQITSTNQDAKVKDNDIVIGDNSSLTTGSATTISQNSGGFNVNMTNSGNNVVMQNTTNLNIFLGQQP
jgi:hypothetical protein